LGNEFDKSDCKIWKNKGVLGRPLTKRRVCLFFCRFTRFKGGPVESMGHNVLAQNMLLAAFAIFTRFSPIESIGHNMLPQNMLLVFLALFTRFKGGPVESMGHIARP